MSIPITIIVGGNGPNNSVDFDMEPSSTMEELLALVSSVIPVPDPPFIIRCGSAILYNSSDPSSGCIPFSMLGIRNKAIFTLIPARTSNHSNVPPPMNNGNNAITAQDVIRATQLGQQNQSFTSPPPPSHSSGITGDDVLKALGQKPSSSSSSSPIQPQLQQRRFNEPPRIKFTTADQFIQYAKTNQHFLNTLIQKNHKLAEAVLSEDKKMIQDFLDIVNKREELERKARENPLDLDVQRQIEEEIHNENIHKNFMETYEDNPELLLGVNLLYVRCKVNGVEIVGMIDTGAQVTVMSSEIARKCNLTWLIDTKNVNVMKGVGEAKTVGKIYGTMLQFGGIELQCSITVVDTNIDFIIGCDQLRRHKCVVDLANNVLRIGSTEVPFLSEKDIPKKERIGEDDDKDS